MKRPHDARDVARSSLQHAVDAIAQRALIGAHADRDTKPERLGIARPGIDRRHGQRHSGRRGEVTGDRSPDGRRVDGARRHSIHDRALRTCAVGVRQHWKSAHLVREPSSGERPDGRCAAAFVADQLDADAHLAQPRVVKRTYRRLTQNMNERGFKQMNSGGRYWEGIRLIDTNG